MYAALFLAMITYNIMTRLQEYGDEVVDNLIMVCVMFMWLTQPSEIRIRDAPSIMAITFTLKISSWVDRESNEVDIR
jgi:hypothetical protein